MTVSRPSSPTTSVRADANSPVIRKLSGREFYESIGSPKKVIAPMVDQSELAWRIFSRHYGADLCYTPMLHARLFATQEKYREQMWSNVDGDMAIDRPLVVQFCANEPEILLQAAKLVEDKCDAVDLNLGCPQNIAKRGKYGSFLMEDWDLIYNLINILHVNLSIPVTAKIRVFPSKEKTLAYAKHVLSAGAQILTVHGRTREMKGQATGLADWSIIRYLRENLPLETVIFANGNILYQEDIARCLDATGADAVMSAEANLYNPAIFNRPLSYTQSIPLTKEETEGLFPRVDLALRKYCEILNECPGEASRIAAKSHFFRLLRPFLSKHTNVRQEIASLRKTATKEDYENITAHVETIMKELMSASDFEEKDKITRSVQPMDEAGAIYKDIPYWRSQPYFRPVNGEILFGGKRPAPKDDNVADALPQPKDKQR
ncbi:dihydrouridine synthase-domain-containing protein [Dipodascopsis uninucleata]